MGLAPGYLVSKHVKLVRALKRGGMGSVWVAEHTALKTEVAVKFISGGFSDDSRGARPLQPRGHGRGADQEPARRAGPRPRPHDRPIPFIVMELLEGEDLSTHLKRVKRMPLEQVATVLLQTCRVLTKAHKLGIIHRDIKPGNIFLVDAEGDIFVKLLDFGIAKSGSEPSEITGTGAMVGTLCYMSPEQLMSSRRVDHRADLWSLAVVIYRAITGELPFKDDDGLGALCRSLESGIFFPPSEYVKDLPHDVDAFFEKAFQRDPAARFASAKEMADELFLAIGQTLAVMPPSTSRVPLLTSAEPPRSRSPCRRRRRRTRRPRRARAAAWRRGRRSTRCPLSAHSASPGLRSSPARPPARPPLSSRRLAAATTPAPRARRRADVRGHRVDASAGAPRRERRRGARSSRCSRSPRSSAAASRALATSLPRASAGSSRSSTSRAIRRRRRPRPLPRRRRRQARASRPRPPRAPSRPRPPRRAPPPRRQSLPRRPYRRARARQRARRRPPA